MSLLKSACSPRLHGLHGPADDLDFTTLRNPLPVPTSLYATKYAIKQSVTSKGNGKLSKISVTKYYPLQNHKAFLDNMVWCWLMLIMTIRIEANLICIYPLNAVHSANSSSQTHPNLSQFRHNLPISVRGRIFCAHPDYLQAV